MLKKNLIIASLVLLFAFLLPTSTALTLVEVTHKNMIFDDKIAYLNHHPAATKKPMVIGIEIQISNKAIERNYLANLPKNLDELDVKARKKQFISTMLPLVLRVNELIKSDRSQVEALRSKQILTIYEETWVLKTAKLYKLPSDTVADINFTELLLRINTIPPSLAIAQAAIESGWGTSRFAKHANALYGQWTWSDHDDAGIVPQGRPDGATYRIKSFNYLIQSVRAYALNLNSHIAYDSFRKGRALNNNGNSLTSHLTSYSTRREAYVNDLQNIIRTNKLSRLDDIALKP
jgi:Bax protein